jgi:hypothetical protein
MTREKARHAWALAAIDTTHENTANIFLYDFGFDSSRHTVRISFHDGTIHTLIIGGQTTDRQHFFALFDESPAMYLLTAQTVERLLLQVEDMLDLSLPHMQIQDAEYVRVERNNQPPIVLGIDHEGILESPLEGMAGLLMEVGIEQLVMLEPIAGMTLNNIVMMEEFIMPISQLRLLELANIHPADLGPFGLHDPTLEFAFRTHDAEMHLLFGNTFTYNGVEFIYVKHADRPHVFKSLAAHAAILSNLSPLDIAMRSVALIDITDVEQVVVQGEETFTMVMNHVPNSHDISPTVNGVLAEARAFRRAYMNIINISADAEIEPFTPDAEPEFIITYYRINNPNTEIRLYNYNANFLAISLDGGSLEFVTNRRSVALIFEHLEQF